MYLEILNNVLVGDAVLTLGIFTFSQEARNGLEMTGERTGRGPVKYPATPPLAGPRTCPRTLTSHGTIMPVPSTPRTLGTR